ncbi:MAG TPA: V-type ATP synthase subunit F [Spirochaetia bacterium]|nr:V-type ATP synthase subunit F [Spirochaetales bacterium]HRS64653.1 V-type ATP synthase subunit F [Spirochaetia bacterium]HPD79645.1 V-type ATP synthase subunit F [Spirochaetales bacterium]HQG40690.1 V-type ATP synthase subunit F [Spirochaetales bacterium]HQK33789.1 V-type ATP synthase subunit F [Spirochaetales bacterium]
MKYFVLGDEDTVLGFGLSGVKGKIVQDSEEASRIFHELLSNGEIGIIIITEKIAAMIRKEVDAFVFSEQFPLIVEIPDRNGHLPGKPGVRELAAKTIGIKL